jgi:acetyl-CoA C-acetyltransferase
MREAWIIDAVRTPAGIGKAGQGRAGGHPSAAAGRDRAEGARRAQQPEDRRGRRHHLGHLLQRGKQGGDMGRMAALDAGYHTKASGVTLDRFCGSGITSVNLAAAQIMSGMEDLVIAGGTEMMSYTSSTASKDGPMLMDSGNLRLRAKHPQSHQGVCADAIARWRASSGGRRRPGARKPEARGARHRGRPLR